MKTSNASTRSAPLPRELTPFLRIADAWDARDHARVFRGALHPYAVCWAETLVLDGDARARGIVRMPEVR
jgi:hypothetical protein